MFDPQSPKPSIPADSVGPIQQVCRYVKDSFRTMRDPAGPGRFISRCLFDARYEDYEKELQSPALVRKNARSRLQLSIAPSVQGGD
jgi:hypothetical protein